MDTLQSRGYAFNSFNALLRESADNLGVVDYWLADDAIVIRMGGLDISGPEVFAEVEYYYTYDRRSAGLGSQVCYRRLRIDFDYVDEAWQAVESWVVGQC